jgi:hypothetical protein
MAESETTVQRVASRPARMVKPAPLAATAVATIPGPRTPVINVPSSNKSPSRRPELEPVEPAEPAMPAPANPRQERRPLRAGEWAERPGDPQIDQRLAEARQRKLFKRRVRGEDYEQVTVILDRALYLELDRRLAELSAQSGGVKVSRSILVRALLRSFLTRAGALSFQGLFTPDPRSQEELQILEAALVERLG